MQSVIPSLFIVIMWNVLFWFIFPLKIQSGGVYETESYFTNWTFGITGGYFTIHLLAFLDRTRALQKYVYFYLFWMVLGQNLIVFFLVFALMALNWSLMSSMVRENGGEYTFGEVVDLEKVFHVLPTFFLVYLYAIDEHSIRNSLVVIRSVMNKRKKVAAWLVIIMHFLSAMFFFLFFQIFIGFEQMYDIKISWLYGLLTSLAILVFFMGPLYYNVFPSRHYARKMAEFA